MKIFAFAAAIGRGGCTVAAAPIAHTPNVTTPQPGRAAVSVQSAPTVSEVIPVYVSIGNGTDDTPTVVPNQIFAPFGVRERLAAWRCQPPGQQCQGARRSDKNRHRKGVWGSAGALVGTGCGCAWAPIKGAELSQSKADQQIEALSLKPTEVPLDFAVKGYVFYPKG